MSMSVGTRCGWGGDFAAGGFIMMMMIGTMELRVGGGSRYNSESLLGYYVITFFFRSSWSFMASLFYCVLFISNGPPFQSRNGLHDAITPRLLFDAWAVLFFILYRTVRSDPTCAWTLWNTLQTRGIYSPRHFRQIEFHLRQSLVISITLL